MFHTFDERSRPARRPAGSPGRRPLQGRRAHGRMSSHPLSTHYCAALDAHVAAVVRSLRCCLVSSGRISARAPRVAPLSKSHGHFSARAAIRSRARRASFIFPGTDRVCAVSFSVHYRSPLFPQLSFLCKHMCASFVLLLRARAPLSFAACAPALSSPPPMRPVRPCSANCIPYTCPWFPASMRRSCLSLRNPGTIFMTPPSHFAFYMSASAARFSMCSAHRWCSGAHRSNMSALELLCLLLGL